MKATNENLLLWEQRIKERIQSGLTVDEWCNRNDISKHKYNYWNHKIRENQNQATNKEIVFADVTANLTNTYNAGKESAALVSLKFKLNPHSGSSVFLFCNKRHNTLRALRWDGNGFVLVTKALVDDMKFQWPKSEEVVRDITKCQLEWLLQGLQIDQKKAHKNNIDTSKMIY